MPHHHSAHILGVSGFFIFGLVGSLHCLLMCGPLSAIFLRKTAKNQWGSLWPYHGARIFIYSLIGFIMAHLGVRLNQATQFPIVIAILGIVLVLLALGIEWPSPRFLVRFQSAVIKHMQNLSAPTRGILMGVMTPLLPCGLLYGAFLASLAAPSPAMGALWMAAFASGTVPLLFMGQAGLYQLTRRLKPATYQKVLRVLAILTLFVILYMYRMHTH